MSKITESTDAGMSLSTEPEMSLEDRAAALERFMDNIVDGIVGSLQMMHLLAGVAEESKQPEPSLTFAEVSQLLTALLQDATEAAVPSEPEAE